MKAGVPLSKLLSEDRPYLRPIVFVRSVQTATLFEEEEDILKPLAEDVGKLTVSSSACLLYLHAYLQRMMMNSVTYPQQTKSLVSFLATQMEM